MSHPICPKCGTRVPVDTSKRSGDSQVRYHRCQCGYEKTSVVSREEIWPRAPGQRKRLDTTTISGQ